MARREEFTKLLTYHQHTVLGRLEHGKRLVAAWLTLTPEQQKVAAQEDYRAAIFQAAFEAGREFVRSGGQGG